MAIATRSITITGLLTDSAGNPLATQPLDFQHRAQGAAAWTDDGTKNTDATGTAATTVTVSSPGTYDFQVVFAGVAGQWDPGTAQDLGQVVTAKVIVKVTVVIS